METKIGGKRFPAFGFGNLSKPKTSEPSILRFSGVLSATAGGAVDSLGVAPVVALPGGISFSNADLINFSYYAWYNQNSTGHRFSVTDLLALSIEPVTMNAGNVTFQYYFAHGQFFPVQLNLAANNSFTIGAVIYLRSLGISGAINDTLNFNYSGAVAVY
jgi:hypothetical protein